MLETTRVCCRGTARRSLWPSVDNETKKMIRTLGYLSTVGLSMAFAIGLGAGIGYFLDKKLGTGPWLFFVFLGFGIVAAFRNLYLMYKKAKDI